MDAVALGRGAGDDAVEEDHVLVLLGDLDRQVADAWPVGGEIGEFVVVGGEQTAAADAVVQMLGDRPRQRHAIEGRGAAPDLIEDDQAAPRRVIEDRRSLGHLDHEGREVAR